MTQPTAHGTVHIVRRCEILVWGVRRVGQEGVRDRVTQERQQTGGRVTQTHRTREPHQEGQGRAQHSRRRGTARQERQPEQREQGTRMEGMGERAHGRQPQQMGWPGQLAPSLPGARATPAPPASGGGCLPQPRWAVCATGAGAHQGQTSREGEKDIWWTAGTVRGGTGHLGLTHTEPQRGKLWTACGQRRVDSKNSQTNPAITSTTSIRQILYAADVQTAHHATFSIAPTHQLLGSANAETTPARAPADRKRQPDATCEGTGDCPGPRKGTTTRRNVTQGANDPRTCTPASLLTTAYVRHPHQIHRIAVHLSHLLSHALESHACVRTCCFLLVVMLRATFWRHVPVLECGALLHWLLLHPV